MSGSHCPDPAGSPASVADGVDTDADGMPDTVVRADGIDLVLLTDLDGDGYADRVLRIGPDGIAREVGPRWSTPDALDGDPLAGGWSDGGWSDGAEEP